MTEITPFQFPATGQPVRTVTVDGQIRFVGKDAATILGHTNPARAVRDHVPAGHRWVTESVTPSDLGLDPQTVLIDEAGLYRLIMRSNTVLAEEFQEWVTAEVLPAIRETGRYEAPATLGDDLLAELELSNKRTAQAIAIAKGERARAELAEGRIAELEGPARSWDVLASGKGDYSVADAAKILARDPAITIGRDRLFTYMAGLGWVHRQRADGRWRAYQRHVDNGRLSELPQQYEHPRTGEVTLGAPQLRVKPKGLRDLHERLGGTAPLQLDEEVDA